MALGLNDIKNSRKKSNSKRKTSKSNSLISDSIDSTHIETSCESESLKPWSHENKTEPHFEFSDDVAKSVNLSFHETLDEGFDEPTKSSRIKNSLAQLNEVAQMKSYTFTKVSRTIRWAKSIRLFPHVKVPVPRIFHHEES